MVRAVGFFREPRRRHGESEETKNFRAIVCEFFIVLFLVLVAWLYIKI